MQPVGIVGISAAAPVGGTAQQQARSHRRTLTVPVPVPVNLPTMVGVGVGVGGVGTMGLPGGVATRVGVGAPVGPVVASSRGSASGGRPPQQKIVPVAALRAQVVAGHGVGGRGGSGTLTSAEGCGRQPPDRRPLGPVARGGLTHSHGAVTGMSPDDPNDLDIVAVAGGRPQHQVVVSVESPQFRNGGGRTPDSSELCHLIYFALIVFLP